MSEAAGQKESVELISAIKSLPAVWVFTIILSVAVLIFIMIYPLGIGGDYPNHLARTYIEGWVLSSKTLGDYYLIRLSFVPDLTMDLVIPWLSHLIGIYPAGALVCAMAILVGPIAGVMISRRLHGCAAGWLPLVGFASIFSLNLEFGFINFLAASGFGLLAFYYWIGAAATWRRTFLVALFSLFLVVNHALGFLLFGYLVLLWEAAKFKHGERGGFRSFVSGLMFRDSFAFLPGVVFLALGVVGATDLETALPEANIFSGRDVALLAPFRFFSDANSVLTAFTSFLIVVAGFVIGLRSRVFEIDRDMAIVCVGLCVLVLAMPVYFLGIWGLHFRYGAALVILASASIRFRPGSEKVKAGGLGLLVALLALQVANAVPNLARIDSHLHAIRDAMADLPPGAMVLPVTDGLADQAFANHAVALSVIEVGGYAPNLFTNTSPVDVVEVMKPLHAPQAIPISPRQLADGMEKKLPDAANGHWSREFYFNWPTTFTHILFTRADGAEGLDLKVLCPMSEGRGFVLYTVKADPANSCPVSISPAL